MLRSSIIVYDLHAGTGAVASSSALDCGGFFVFSTIEIDSEFRANKSSLVYINVVR